MKFDDLHDDLVLVGLEFIQGGARHTLAQLIGYLAVVLSRRLYERRYSSLHDYCVRGLKMSDEDARLRTEAAHVALRFPPVLDMLKHGIVNLVMLSEDKVSKMTDAEMEVYFRVQERRGSALLSSCGVPFADTVPQIPDDDPDAAREGDYDRRHHDADEDAGEDADDSSGDFSSITLGFTQSGAFPTPLRPIILA